MMSQSVGPIGCSFSDEVGQDDCAYCDHIGDACLGLFYGSEWAELREKEAEEQP